MKNKKLLIGLLLMFAIVVSSGTYAFWTNNINAPTDDTSTGNVTIGEGNDVSTSFVLNGNTTSGGALVPTSQVSNSPQGSVDTVTLSYDVEWQEDGSTSQLDGTTSTADITVTFTVTVLDETDTDVTASVGSLINVTPTSNPTSLTLGDPAQTFTFDVTMSEPANQSEYDAIVNGTVTVTLTYSLSNITTTDN